eukprot:138170_1
MKPIVLDSVERIAMQEKTDPDMRVSWYMTFAKVTYEVMQLCPTPTIARMKGIMQHGLQFYPLSDRTITNQLIAWRDAVEGSNTMKKKSYALDEQACCCEGYPFIHASTVSSRGPKIVAITTDCNLSQ